MKIHFTKMHGLGNDFMVINAVHQTLPLTPAIIRQWADRHTGIGFDQLLCIETAPDPAVDFFYRIFNADGSEVAQCGNGARCIAKFIRDNNLSQKDHIKVATMAGNLALQLENNDHVTVNMGVPKFDPSEIPLQEEYESDTYELDISQQKVKFSALSLGNPHCVLLVTDVATAPVQALGTALAKHPVFPKGTNVGFMQIINRQRIGLRVYERGADETLACGSGACAAVVAGHTLGLLDKEVTVMQTGGELKVQWQGKNSPVFLTGPATTVFTGIIDTDTNANTFTNGTS